MSSNLIRFIALYHHGLGFPMTDIILGHGFREEGLSHSALVDVYQKREVPIYAGYLFVKGEEISVHSGGSVTLKIEADENRNRLLLEELRLFERMRNAVITLAPHLASGFVAHALIGRQ